MTVINIAVPNRSHQCRSMVPDRPLRPNSSVPGDASGTTTPVGVRASVHNTKRRGLPWVTSPRVSPTNLEPRSKRTMLPSAPKVSVAVTQVVIPGSAELIAVSKVQSINAPFGSINRCVGSTRALTAGVAVGFSSDARVSPPDPPFTLTSEPPPGGKRADGPAVLSASPSLVGGGGRDPSVDAARTGPPSRRSSSNSSGVLGSGAACAYGLALAIGISGAASGSGGGGGPSTASNAESCAG